MRAIILLLLASTTAHADVANELTVGSFNRALRSDSSNALTENSLVGPAFGYARKLPVSTGALELWGTASFLLGFTDGTMFETLSTDVAMVQPSVGARATYPLWRDHVVATARLDAGVQRARVTIEDSMGHEASDHGWGAMTTAALGLDLVPLATARFELGVRLELGYVATTGIDLTAKSDGPADDDTLELERMAASLGALDVGGRYFAFTVTTRF